MATYTTNGGIKKIATGDESGTWGTSTNTNFDIIDRLAVGVGSISLSGTTHTLTTSEGAASDGQYHVLVLGGSPSGTNTITVSPNDAARLYVVKNNSGQTATFTQGSGANVSVSNGKSAIIYCDGAGSGAAVVDITSTFVGTTTLSDLGVTASATELNYNDISSLGNVQASKTVTADSNADVHFGDNDKMTFGASNDLQLFHDGSNSIIHDNGTGNLNIRADDFNILNAGATETKIAAASNGAVTLYYDNSAKLATFSGGVSVTGSLNADGLSLGDSEIANFGNSNDLQIYHDGSNSYIDDTGTGNLRIKGQQIDILTGSGENAAYFETNGTARLYYDNSIKIATISTGVDITGTALTDGLTVNGLTKIEEILEKVLTSTATSGTLNIELIGDNGAVFFATNNQTANRTINFRGDGSTTLNNSMAIGESFTSSVLMTQGTTAYYLNAYQVDGSAVTPKWSGGSAPTAGNASSIDVYTFTIIKTANATFTVLASQTQFA
jgi:hypothetical protein